MKTWGAENTGEKLDVGVRERERTDRRRDKVLVLKATRDDIGRRRRSSSSSSGRWYKSGGQSEHDMTTRTAISYSPETTRFLQHLRIAFVSVETGSRPSLLLPSRHQRWTRPSWRWQSVNQTAPRVPSTDLPLSIICFSPRTAKTPIRPIRSSSLFRQLRFFSRSLDTLFLLPSPPKKRRRKPNVPIKEERLIFNEPLPAILAGYLKWIETGRKWKVKEKRDDGIASFDSEWGKIIFVGNLIMQPSLPPAVEAF